jgi:hypothetical protein
MGTAMSEVRQAAYLEALDDIATGALEYAVNAAIRVNHTFPKPVELRELSRSYRPPGERPGNFVQLAPVTSYNETLANEAFKEILEIFGDGWGLPTTRGACK